MLSLHRIFRDSREPFYGNADRHLKVLPFTTSVLKEILSDVNSGYAT